MPPKNHFKPGPSIGTKFGKLTVIAEGSPMLESSRQQVPTSICRCDCGRVVTIRNYVLTRKKSPAKSCGCTRRHGQSTRSGASREYRAWQDMKTRCRRDPRYKNISVCPEWLNNFPQFLSDMGECPIGMTLDRIDNTKGYEPGNCRWASWTTQANNRRCNRIIEVNGVKKTVQEWMKHNGLDDTTFYRRLSIGWSEKDAASLPRRGKPT